MNALLEEEVRSTRQAPGRHVHHTDLYDVLFEEFPAIQQPSSGPTDVAVTFDSRPRITVGFSEMIQSLAAQQQRNQQAQAEREAAARNPPANPDERTNQSDVAQFSFD